MVKTIPAPHQGGLLPYGKFIGATVVVAGTEIFVGRSIGSLPLEADGVGHGPSHIIAGIMAMAMVAGWQWAKRHQDKLKIAFRIIVSLLILYGAVFHVLLEAIDRMKNPPEIDGVFGFWIAALGLLGNFYQATLIKACGKHRGGLLCEIDEVMLEDVESDKVMSYVIIANYLVRALGGSPYIEVGVSFLAAGMIIRLALLILTGKHKHAEPHKHHSHSHH